VNASRLVIKNCAVATVAGEEHESGHVAVEDGRISAVGAAGPAPRVELLLVGGEPVVRDAELRTADVETIARELNMVSKRLVEKRGIRFQVSGFC
jgi:hypothetical protein